MTVPLRQTQTPLPARLQSRQDESVAEAGREPVSAAFKHLRIGFLIILFPLIYLQKIALPAGGQEISVTIPALYAGVGYLVCTSKPTINLGRFVAFAVLALVMICSQLLSSTQFSPTALLLILILYLPFVFTWELTPAEFRRASDIYQNLMIVPALMVFIQLAYHVASGWHTLGLNQFVPERFLLSGYVYDAPMQWGKPFVRPNGFFMLEPSFISMFLAIAAITEMSLKRRLIRLALYVSALACTFGATGIVLLALAMPMLLPRQTPQFRMGILAAGVFGVGLGIAGGLGEALFHRLAELGQAGSSGYGRLIQPLMEIAAAAERSNSLLTGVGAGNIDRITTSSTWPLTRLAIEYGFLTSAAFLIFECLFLLGSPAPALAFSLFVIFNFTGGYLPSPIAIILTFAVVAALRVKPELAPDRPSARPAAAVPSA